MMLGGVAPIIIFSFPPVLGLDLGKLLGGIPLIGDTIADIGIPIPIYLDENVTGIFIESESKSLDIDTDIVPVYRATPGGQSATNLINQSGINNLVTVNMLANKDSVILSVLLALNDMVFSKLVSGKYKISYVNGTTIIFGGLLHSFSVNSSADDTLLKIQMQIQKNNQNKPTVLNQYLNVSAVGPAPTPPGV